MKSSQFPYWLMSNSSILADHKADVRERALRELSATIRNNINSKDIEGSQSDLNVVSLPQLVRHLIRWFQFRPITHESEVIGLLFLVLSVGNDLYSVIIT